MTRLDSAIRRLEAQRACLDRAAALVRGVPGPVLELGLGNGRTYDHLRARLPGRDIFVFERAPAAHPDCTPPEDRLIVGDFLDTLPMSACPPPPPSSTPTSAPATRQASLALAKALAPLLPRLTTPGAVLAADQPMPLPGWTEEPLPEGVAPGRYRLYRRPARAERRADTLAPAPFDEAQDARARQARGSSAISERPFRRARPHIVMPGLVPGISLGAIAAAAYGWPEQVRP